MGTAAAFTPSGNTVTFTANVSAPIPVQVVSSTLGGNQYRIINAGSVTTFLGFGRTANKMLAQTDWMVIRKAERGVDIPADIVAKRAAIVDECTKVETAIIGCANVEELIDVVMNQKWPN